jgi:peptidoglycan/LPS O-acetylase OafA/YrhL
MTSPKPVSMPDHGRYNFLDGLRGLFVLYAVYYHCWQATAHISETDQFVQIFVGLTNIGFPALSIFFVLSGFLLTLPVTKTGRLSGGLTGFIKRRFVRIYPPYFVALCLSAILVLWIAPGLFNDPNVWVNGFWPARPKTDFIMHALLLHNLRDWYVFGFNVPLWCIATEWQFYFVFALVLFPLRSRFGSLSALIVGLVLAVAVSFVPTTWISSKTNYWLIGTFAIGSFAAEIAEGQYRSWLARGPWSLLAAIAALGVGVWVVLRVFIFQSDQIWRIPIGCLFATGIASFILSVLRGDRWSNRIATVLRSRWAMVLGSFSYSLFLTHGPIIGALDSWLCHQGLHALERELILVFVGIPLCLAFAYGFYLLIELPTIQVRSKARVSPNQRPMVAAQGSS